MLTLLVVVLTAQVGCSKDTDCKGDRICEAGRCVSPAPAVPQPETNSSQPPPAPPLVPAAPPKPADGEYPKVLRRDGQVCVQSLEPDGTVSESCRADTPRVKRAPMDAAAPTPTYELPQPGTRRRRRARSEPEAPPEWSRFVADFSVNGGFTGALTTGGSGVAGCLGGYVSFGGRFVEGFGLGAALDEKLIFAPGGVISLTTLGPALRLGKDVHATLTPGASIVSGNGVVGVTFALLIHIAIPVAAGFGFHLNTGLSADASGVLLPLTLGIGGSVF